MKTITEQKTSDTWIRFDGYYDSFLSGLVDSQEEYYSQELEKGGKSDEYGYSLDEWGCLLHEGNGVNYKAIYNKINSNIVGLVNDYLGTKMKYKGMTSPKEYNFSTDILDVTITNQDALQIFKYIKENNLKQRILDAIKYDTTSRSGYMPFYSYDDMFLSKNRDMLMACILTSLWWYLRNDDENCSSDITNFTWDLIELGIDLEFFEQRKAVA